MRLIHFAFSITVILLGITGYLAWEGQQEARGARKELEFIRNQREAMGVDEQGRPLSAAPPPLEVPPSAPVPALSPAPPVERTATAAPTAEPAGSSVLGVTAEGDAGKPAVPGGRKTPASLQEMPLLTSQQKKVAASDVVARVTDVKLKEGFVVIDAGSANGISAGQSYDVRRGAGLVGRVRISDTIVEGEAVADVLPEATPPGVKIEIGDELVKMPAS